MATERFQVVQSPTDGVYFIVDHSTGTRYRITGQGQLAGAIELYGQPVEFNPSVNDGWTEGQSVLDLFGGAGGIEAVIAGEAINPLGGVSPAPQIPEIPGIGGPPGTGGGGGGAADDEPTPEQREAKAIIGELLDEFGLGSLIDDAWEWILEGLSETEIMQEIRKTEEWKDQFGVIIARREAGLAPMSERQVIEYRQQAARLLRAHGLPERFYDEHTDFDTLLASDIGLPELQARIEEGFARVAQAPAEVREAFADLFGVQGDGALAAYFLEPDEDRALSVLLEQVRTAEVAGAGSMFGFDVAAGQAQELARFGFDLGGSLQGFRQAAQFRSLTEELPFERFDFTEEDLIGGTFGLDGEGLEALRRRQEARVAPFSGGGGAVVGAQGVSGAGAAR